MILSSLIIAAVLVAAVLVTTSRLISFKRLLGLATPIDVIFSVMMFFVFAGTLSGVIIATIAGLIIECRRASVMRSTTAMGIELPKEKAQADRRKPSGASLCHVLSKTSTMPCASGSRTPASSGHRILSCRRCMKRHGIPTLIAPSCNR